MKHTVLRQYNHFIWHHIFMSVSVWSYPLYRWYNTDSIYDITSTVYMAQYALYMTCHPYLWHDNNYSWHQSYYISTHTDYIWQHIHCISVITSRLSIIKPPFYVWYHSHNMYDIIWTTYEITSTLSDITQCYDITRTVFMSSHPG